MFYLVVVYFSDDRRSQHQQVSARDPHIPSANFSLHHSKTQHATTMASPPPASSSGAASTNSITSTTTTTNAPLPIPSDLIPHRTRLRDSDGFLGTVRYVGPVASAKKATEIYVGVEWDDASRGRHDGSVVCRATNGLVRHFRCRNGGRGAGHFALDGGSGETAAAASSSSDSSHRILPAAAAASSASSTAGSFLRLSRRNVDWDTGRALSVPLLLGRYVPPGADLVAPENILPDCHARTSSGRTKPIELIGELNIRARQQPERLGSASLRSMGISGGPPPRLSEAAADSSSEEEEEEEEGEGAELTRRFGHLTELDLAGNLLCGWDAVGSVLAPFPALTKVGLAGNRLGDRSSADSLGEKMAARVGRMEVLNLNNTGIATFATVAWLVGDAMPHLTELCLAHSDLADLDRFEDGIGIPPPPPPPPRPVGGLAHLRLLDLSDCNLTDWKNQIGRLAVSCPVLTDLILNDNPLGVIEPFDADGGDGDDDESGDGGNAEPRPGYFPSLATLQLTNVGLAAWSSIDALHSLFGARLQSLRFRGNPVTSPLSAAEARSATIARLPHLEYLNASPIGDKERTDSERRYVGTVARELLLAETAAAAAASAGGEGSDSNDDGKEDGAAARAAAQEGRRAAILADHPRFAGLTAKHRDAMAAARAAAAGAAAGGGSLSHDAVNVTVRSMAASSCGAAPLRRRLPGSLAVGRVKILCSRAFGLDVDLQTLHFRSSSSSGDGRDAEAFPTELDDDDRALSYYGVGDGAEILMNEIDVAARQREAERERSAQERRMEEQERTATALQAASAKGFEVKA